MGNGFGKPNVRFFRQFCSCQQGQQNRSFCSTTSIVNYVPMTSQHQPSVLELTELDQDSDWRFYVAIYDYEGYSVEGELDFKKGDYLEVIGKYPTGWWKARRLGITTLEGYIPSNFVTRLESFDIDREQWYFGNISRYEANDLLLMEGNRNGSFLIRQPETGTHKYTLSVLIGNTVKHFRINEENGPNGECVLYIGNSLKFDKLQGLIQFYRYNRPYKDSLGTKLTVPCIKVRINPSMVLSPFNMSFDYKNIPE